MPLYTVKLTCGLGNHLFQIASIWALAQKHGASFVLERTTIPRIGHTTRVYKEISQYLYPARGSWMAGTPSPATSVSPARGRLLFLRLNVYDCLSGRVTYSVPVWAHKNMTGLVCADSDCKDNGVCKKSWLGYCYAGGRWITQLARSPAKFLSGQLVIRDANNVEVSPDTLITDIIEGEAYSFNAESKRDIKKLLRVKTLTKVDRYVLLHYIVTRSGTLIKAGLDGEFPLVPVSNILRSSLSPTKKLRLLQTVAIPATGVRTAVALGAAGATFYTQSKMFNYMQNHMQDYAAYSSKYPLMAANGSMPQTTAEIKKLTKNLGLKYHPDKDGNAAMYAALTTELAEFKEMFKRNA